MYSTRSIIVSLGFVAVLLLILVCALIFREERKTATQQVRIVNPETVTNTTTAAIEPERESREVVPQEEFKTSEVSGSDFNMEFPTLDE
jgi:hypothetical protein